MTLKIITTIFVIISGIAMLVAGEYKGMMIANRHLAAGLVLVVGSMFATFLAIFLPLGFVWVA